MSEKELMEKDAASIVGPSLHKGPSPPRFACFGPFYLDTCHELLYRDKLRVKLFGKPIKLLRKLIESSSEIVSRDELCRELWAGRPQDAIDANLHTNLNKLRKALGDSSSQPLYIETLPGVGFCFMAPVQYLDSPPPENSVASPLKAQRVSASRRVLSWQRRHMHPDANALMVLITATLVGFGGSLVWVEGIRARSLVGLVKVSLVAAAIAAMVLATARLISRSRKTVAKAMPGRHYSDH